MSKRTRSVNWDEEEKQLFRSVLKDFTQIIEDKTLTTNTNKLKTKAWEDVHQKFNSLNSRERDMNQLKIQWKGMKMAVRKEYGNYKRETNKTGGGARPATPDDSIMEIKDMLNPAELIIDHNIYDSDGTDANKQMDTDVDTQIQENTLEFNINLQTAKSKDEMEIFATPNINARKKPARELIQNKRKYGVPKAQMEHADYVYKITQHSKELKEKEHFERMAMAEKKHALEILILEENLKTAKEILKTAQIERQIAEKKLEKLS